MLVETEKSNKKDKKEDGAKYIILNPRLKTFAECFFNILLNKELLESSSLIEYNTADILEDLFNEDYESFCEDIPNEYSSMSRELFEALLSHMYELEEMNGSNGIRNLSVDSRRKKALSMKRNKNKVLIARKRALHRRANKEQIEKRAKRAAINTLKNKFSGSKKYNKMTPSERRAVDKRLSNVTKETVSTLSKKMVSKVKKIESSRINAKSDNKEGSSRIPSAVIKSAVSKTKDRLGDEKNIKEGYSIVAPSNKEIAGLPKRIDMPQIDMNDLRHLKSFLGKNEVGYTKKNVDPEDLKPSQSEFNLQKVKSIVRKFEDVRNTPIIISKEGDVIDGHHRWLAFRHKKEDIPVIQINKTTKACLKFLKKYPKSFTKAINENIL